MNAPQYHLSDFSHFDVPGLTTSDADPREIPADDIEYCLFVMEHQPPPFYIKQHPHIIHSVHHMIATVMPHFQRLRERKAFAMVDGSECAMPNSASVTRDSVLQCLASLSQSASLLMQPNVKVLTRAIYHKDLTNRHVDSATLVVIVNQSTSSSSHKHSGGSEPQVLKMPSQGFYCDRCNAPMGPEQMIAVSPSYAVPVDPNDVSRIYCRECASDNFFVKLGHRAELIERAHQMALQHLKQSGQL